MRIKEKVLSGKRNRPRLDDSFLYVFFFLTKLNRYQMVGSAILQMQHKI
jgi:hypothetical protein